MRPGLASAAAEMAAPLSLSKANITRTDQSPLSKVSLLIRQSHAVVRSGRQIVAEADVATVVPVSRGEWTVTLVDGTVWTVKRDKDCGCGGSR